MLHVPGLRFTFIEIHFFHPIAIGFHKIGNSVNASNTC